jgi:ATP-dependent Zn protease
VTTLREAVASTPERERTAAHEAGHAAVAYILGRSTDVISIRPGEHWSGVTIHKRGRRPRTDTARTFQDVLLWPADWRRFFEHDLGGYHLDTR